MTATVPHPQRTDDPPAGRGLGAGAAAADVALWNPRLVELSCAANAVSLMMPAVEPYFVRTVRAAIERLPEDRRAAAERLAVEEARHHAQHHAYNARLTADAPGMARFERAIGRTCAWLGRTRSLRTNLAVAAGSETLGHALGAWLEPHLHRLDAGGERAVARLFVWHLAEEVDHTELARDVYAEVGGGRLRYLVGVVTAVALLSAFASVGTLSLLWSRRRLRHPLTWLRLLRWSVAAAFSVLPALALAGFPGRGGATREVVGFRLWLADDGLRAASV